MSVLKTEVLPLNYFLIIKEAGLEPTASVWKTDILPLNYSLLLYNLRKTFKIKIKNVNFTHKKKLFNTKLIKYYL